MKIKPLVERRIRSALLTRKTPAVTRNKNETVYERIRTKSRLDKLDAERGGRSVASIVNTANTIRGLEVMNES